MYVAEKKKKIIVNALDRGSEREVSIFYMSCVLSLSRHIFFIYELSNKKQKKALDRIANVRF